MSVIAEPLLKWYHYKGKQELPWHSPDPYRVWVSEIMLQQTQVATVKGYFTRFIDRFPTVKDLAAASIDEVMSLWAGLGYYSRARHLHLAAKLVMKQHQGQLPLNFDELVQLPGIGASTAGAILSLSRGLRYPILDTNVKRVLIRYFALLEDPGAQLNKKLWAIAEEQLPQEQVGKYNQALMNLGASICRSAQPLCNICPLHKGCLAYQNNLQLPKAKAKRIKPERQGYFAFVINNCNEVLVERRPPIGIWSNLWCPPQFDNLSQLHNSIQQRFCSRVSFHTHLSPLKHSFSHFNLLIQPVIARLTKSPAQVAETNHMWYSIEKKQQAGLPAPMNRLMKEIAKLNNA